ncbi:MAG: DUF2812 domain-containing protein [Anaerolineaceae bacterium]|nr:DUF2812 domain-containing protein [Anaerolineaceae bacterium]
MNRFILLLNHDDHALSAYLQHCLENGEQFVKSSGNIFTFGKTSSHGEKIKVVTYKNEDPDLKMKFQMEDYSALMKKRGWRVLHIGNPEDIFDSKRHVFLQTDKNDLPDPITDPGLAEKAQKREQKSVIRCMAMLLLLLGFAIFFVGHDPDILLSSNHILIPGVLAFLFWVLSLIYGIKGIFVIKAKKQCENGFKNFLSVDNAVLYCMISVFLLLISLVMDLYLYPDNGQYLVKGEQRIKIYQDTLPLRLGDLAIDSGGIYSSRRLTERNGFLMKSLYGSDQSFSDLKGTENLSLLSYSVYQSDWNAGLDWIASVKGLQKLPSDDDLSVRWKSDEVHTDGHHRLSARYPGTLLVFSTSAEIKDIDPEIVLNELSVK